MTPNPQKTSKLVFSAPILTTFGKEQIDAENGILHEVVMVQEGPAAGHFVHLEAGFISSLVAYDQKNFAKSGLKGYFGHRFGADAMGAQLGNFRNFRKRQAADGRMEAIADFHLLQAAKRSPQFGNMFDWVLEMAAEAPNMIMSSIVFEGSRYYQKKANGHKRYIWEYDADDNWQYHDSKLGNVYVEFTDNTIHHRTDLVDDGAATQNLFENNPLFFHPSPSEDATPVLPEPKPIKLKMTFLESLFGKSKPENETTLSPDEVVELRQKLGTVETELSTRQTKITSLEKQVGDLTTERDDFKTKYETAITELEALKKHPAAPRTAGAKEEETPVENAWHNTDVNRQAQQEFSQRSKKKLPFD